MALSVMTSNKAFTKVYANMLIITLYTMYMIILAYKVVYISVTTYLTIKLYVKYVH